MLHLHANQHSVTQLLRYLDTGMFTAIFTLLIELLNLLLL